MRSLTNRTSQRTLADWQSVITEWMDYNFDTSSRQGTLSDLFVAVVGLTEELGELARALVKAEQGIRGTREEWMLEAEKELGDIFVCLVDVTRALAFDLGEVVAKRWETLSQRDWKADPKGHGLPDA